MEKDHRLKAKEHVKELVLKFHNKGYDIYGIFLKTGTLMYQEIINKNNLIENSENPLSEEYYYDEFLEELKTITEKDIEDIILNSKLDKRKSIIKDIKKENGKNN